MRCAFSGVSCTWLGARDGLRSTLPCTSCSSCMQDASCEQQHVSCALPSIPCSSCTSSGRQHSASCGTSCASHGASCEVSCASHSSAFCCASSGAPFGLLCWRPLVL